MVISYKKYKESTEIFRNLENNRASYYTKAPESLKKYSVEKLENDGSVGVFDLLDAFQKLLERQQLNKPLNTKITKKEINVEDKIKEIRNILDKKSRINFLELFDNNTKENVVVTFLSILEMCKIDEIILTQEDNFSPIMIEKRV